MQIVQALLKQPEIFSVMDSLLEDPRTGEPRSIDVVERKCPCGDNPDGVIKILNDLLRREKGWLQLQKIASDTLNGRIGFGLDGEEIIFRSLPRTMRKNAGVEGMDQNVLLRGIEQKLMQKLQAGRVQL